MSTLNSFAKYFDKYIELHEFTGDTYTYKARSVKPFREIRSTFYQTKSQAKNIVYIALDSNADINNLQDKDKLYIGSQTVDRMHRGDGKGGKNFHHKEMRTGNGSENLENYLKQGNSVTVYILDKAKIESITQNDPDLIHLHEYVRNNSNPKKIGYYGYWIEQLILHEEGQNWSWNKKGAEVNVRTLMF